MGNLTDSKVLPIFFAVFLIIYLFYLGFDKCRLRPACEVPLSLETPIDVWTVIESSSD